MKILVVDDNKENRYLLESLLEESGHEAAAAADGLEALKLLKSTSFDMIVSDILMPGMDGFQLCRACKQDKALRGIPFIFYTATYVDKKDEEFALSLGAERFIVKPTQIETLLKILKEVISRHEERTLIAPREPVEDESLYLAQYNQRLINKLEKKMLDLQEANRILQDSEDKYHKYVLNVADELRNPLQILKSSLELFSPDNLSQEQARLFNMFRKNLTLLEDGIKKLT